MSEKICLDCRWSQKLYNDSDLVKCHSPKTMYISKVSGRPTQEYDWASVQRLHKVDWIEAISGSKMCGKQGRFWEPKEYYAGDSMEVAPSNALKLTLIKGSKRA